MRKWIAAILALALLLAPAPGQAVSASSSNKLFASAKQAVGLIGYGEYQKALKALGLPSDPDSVDALDAFVQVDLSSALDGDVQKTVAVLFAVAGGYELAVPIEPPDMPDVQALVLTSTDGKTFDSYTEMDWGDVEIELRLSDSVVWNKAYVPDMPVVVADE